MMIPRTEGGFVASKILTFTANDTRPPKIINRPANTVTRPPIPLYAAADRNDQPSREVSETDLYLLGALEKMAYKIDNMEKRIRHLEEMLYSVVAGNKIDTGMNLLCLKLASSGKPSTYPISSSGFPNTQFSSQGKFLRN